MTTYQIPAASSITTGGWEPPIYRPGNDWTAPGDRIIISLFDESGEWSKPYQDAGYFVIQQDLKLGHDIFEHTLPEIAYLHHQGFRCHGILAACPCTDFANSGARWWEQKKGLPAPYDSKDVQFDDRLEFFIAMVYATMEIIELMQPEWWALENPRGRIRQLCPEIGAPRLRFQPCDYGDPWTKETFIYGSFNADLKKSPVSPTEGSLAHRLSGNDKAGRSKTPPGFAKAFFNANR